MMRWKNQFLVSFDGTESERGAVARPERYADLLHLLSGKGTSIARGPGLSYAGASMARGTVSVDMRRFDRLLITRSGTSG
ncbi:MAG: hypothetical protein ABJA82_00095 [Myxococcales bacterium]